MSVYGCIFIVLKNIIYANVDSYKQKGELVRIYVEKCN